MGEDEVTRWERAVASKKAMIARLQEDLKMYKHPSQKASVRSRIASEKSGLEYAKGQLKIAKANAKKRK